MHRHRLLLALVFTLQLQSLTATSPFVSPTNFDWVAQFSVAPILKELQALSNADTLFSADWQNLATHPYDWTSITLLNKGVIDTEGCAHAPTTCALLFRLVNSGILSPTVRASEVGARVLRLAPGARLRPHRGPGGRFVARQSSAAYPECGHNSF